MVDAGTCGRCSCAACCQAMGLHQGFSRRPRPPGFPRFVLVDVGPGGESSSSEMDPSSDGLENLKLEELVQYAKEGDVDIFGVESDKAEIINRIRNADKESLA